MPARVLVLDESGVLPWVVSRLCPRGTEVVAATQFEEACRLVAEHPPDAAVVSLPPARLAWRRFQHLCAERAPPGPVLYESCVFSRAAEAGLEPLEGWAEVLAKPASKGELEAALDRLLAAASPRRGARATRPEGAPPSA